MKLEYNDSIGSCGIIPHLAFVYGGKIIPFMGQSIAPFCVIQSQEYTKNGKWSHTIYQMEIADNVGIFQYRRGMHTESFFDVQCWNDMLSVFISMTKKIVTINELKGYMIKEFHDLSNRLNSVEQKIANLNIDTQIEVSFGSPTNRQMSEGYWTQPQEIPNHQGVMTLIDLVKGWEMGNITVPSQFEILAVNHSPGHHGGYYSVILCPKK